MNRSTIALTATAFAAAASGVLAQARLDSDSLNTRVEVEYFDLDLFNHGQYDAGTSANGSSFLDTRSVSWSGDGIEGSASNTNHTHYGPSDPGIGGLFSRVLVDMGGRAGLTASNTGMHGGEESVGDAYSYIYFTLDEATAWSWEADVDGFSSPGHLNLAACTFYVWDLGLNAMAAFDERRSLNGASDFAEHMSVGGILGPGSYFVRISASGDVVNEQGLGGPGSAWASIANGVFTIPSPGLPAMLGLLAVLGGRRRR